MKKTMIRVLALCCIILSTLGLIACGSETAVNKIKGIEIVNTPKTEYSYEEDLDLTDFSMKVIYQKKTVTYAYADIENCITVSGYDKKKAGKQTVTVTYKVTEKKDVYEGTVEFEVTVAKAKGDVTLGTNLDKVYDGMPIEISTADYNTNSDGVVTVKWMNDGEEVKAPTNAGEYKLVVSVPATETYTEATAEKIVTISKKAIEKPTYTASSFAFDNTEKTANITESELYTISDNVKTNAGNYTAKVVLNDKTNYTWIDGTDTDITFDWTISSAIGTLTFNNDYNPNKTYDGNAVADVVPSNYTKNGDGNVTVEWFVKDGVTALTERPTNVGQYTVKLTVAETINYTTASASKDFEITKQLVDKAVYTESNFVYDGNEKTANITENSLYTISGNKETNAKVCTATVKLNDNDNYAWADGTNTDLTFSWSIARKPLAIPTFDNNLIFNNSEQIAKIPTSNLYTITGNTAKDAGEYTATLTLANGNYEWTDKSIAPKQITWNIFQRKVQKPVLNSNSLVYTGNSQLADITVDTTENHGFFDKISGSVAETNAGDYFATYALRYNEKNINVVWNDDRYDTYTLSWKIAKQQVNKPTYTESNFVYDGNEKTANITASELYTISDNVKTNADSYKAKVVLKDKTNYTWDDKTDTDITFDWTILSATGTLAFANDFNPNKVYDKNAVADVVAENYVKNGDGAVTVEWFVKDSTTALTDKPVNAGEYTVKVTVAGTQNFTTVSATKDFEISKCDIAIPTLTADDLVFNNSTQTAKIPTNELYTITGNTAYNAGEYTATLTLTNSNYAWEDKSIEPKTISWKIAKLTVQKPTCSVTNFTYNKTQQGINVTIDTENWGYVTHTGTIYGTNAGNYSTTYSLRYNTQEVTNIVWNDNSSADVTISWNIAKRVVQKPVLNSNNLVYNQDWQNADIIEDTENAEFYEIIGGAKKGLGAKDYTTTYRLKGNSEAVTNVLWSDDSTNDVTISWKIAKKVLQIPTPTQTLTYNGISQDMPITITAEERGYYYVNGNQKANSAGDYSLELQFMDSSSCEWSDGTSESKTITWTIAKKQLTISEPTISSITYTGNTDVLSYVTKGTLEGIVGSDYVNCEIQSATLDNADAGNRNVTIVYSISGGFVNNYLAPVNFTKQVTVEQADGNVALLQTYTSKLNKTYNAKAPSIPMYNLDYVTNNVSGLKTTSWYKLVGEDYTSIDMQSADAGSYRLKVVIGETTNFKQAETTFDFVISPKQLTISEPTIADLVYSSSVDVKTSVSIGALNGIVGEDQVTCDVESATLDNKNAGNDRTVTVAYSLSGSSANNYIKPANFTKENVTVAMKRLNLHDTTIMNGTTREYDGITEYYYQLGHLIVYSAELNASHGVCGEDVVMNKVTDATLDSANVGTRTLTIVYSLCDSSRQDDEYNYYIDPSDCEITITIVTKMVTNAIYAESNFVYDGTEKTAVITTNELYVITGNKQTNAGDYQATVSLKDKTNYAWANSQETTDLTFDWSIAKATLQWANEEIKHVGISTKSYDGTANVNASQMSFDDNVLVLNGAIESDEISVNVANTTAVYGSSAIGENEITVTYAILGNNVGSYDISALVEKLPGKILPKQLTVTGGLKEGKTSKVWDSSTDVDKDWFEFTIDDGCLVGEETVTLDWTATLESSEPQNNVGITVVFTINGEYVNNYYAPENATATINVVKATPIITLNTNAFALCEDMVATVKAPNWLPVNTTYDNLHGTQSVVFYQKGKDYMSEWAEINVATETFYTSSLYKFVYSVSGGTYYSSNSVEVEFEYVDIEDVIVEDTALEKRQSPVVTFNSDHDRLTIVYKFTYTGVDTNGYYAFKFNEVDRASLYIVTDFGKEIKPDENGVYSITVEGESTNLYVVILCEDGAVGVSNHSLLEYPQTPPELLE